MQFPEGTDIKSQRDMKILETEKMKNMLNESK
jgi:hypothetical protein